MAKTRYEKAQKLIEDLKSKGIRRISGEKMEVYIMKSLGSDVDRTIKPYVNLMKKTGLVTTEGDNVVLR